MTFIYSVIIFFLFLNLAQWSEQGKIELFIDKSMLG